MLLVNFLQRMCEKTPKHFDRSLQIYHLHWQCQLLRDCMWWNGQRRVPTAMLRNRIQYIAGKDSLTRSSCDNQYSDYRGIKSGHTFGLLAVKWTHSILYIKVCDLMCWYLKWDTSVRSPKNKSQKCWTSWQLNMRYFWKLSYIGIFAFELATRVIRIKFLPTVSIVMRKGCEN